jgi:hypothetical protein
MYHLGWIFKRSIIDCSWLKGQEEFLSALLSFAAAPKVFVDFADRTMKNYDRHSAIPYGGISKQL